MKLVLTILFTSLLVFNSFGQSVLGKWKTNDIYDSSIAESIVEVYEIDAKLFVRIDSIIPVEHQLDLCSKCSGAEKDQPILGLVIVKGAVQENGIWKGAKILNAKNGNWYGCHISLASSDRLKVRGFIGYPFFGRNFYWTRFENEQ